MQSEFEGDEAENECLSKNLVDKRCQQVKLIREERIRCEGSGV